MSKEERIEYRTKVLNQLDNWIDRYHGLDFKVKPEAAQARYSEIPQTLRITFFPRDNWADVKYSMADILSIALANYQLARTRYIMADVNYESQIFDYAESLLIVIQDLLARGLVEEGEGLAVKLTECEERNKVLQEDNKILSARLVQLEKLSKIARPIDAKESKDDNDDEEGLSP